jgi:hypothetical protein
MWPVLRDISGKGITYVVAKKTVISERGSALQDCSEEDNDGNEWRQSVACLGEIFILNVKVIDFNMYFWPRHKGLHTVTNITF